MKTKRLINALEKHGLKVSKCEKRGNRYTCRGVNNKCSWWDQEGSVCCAQVMGVKEENELYTDYFPGFFAKEIKTIVEYLTK